MRQEMRPGISTWASSISWRPKSAWEMSLTLYSRPVEVLDTVSAIGGSWEWGLGLREKVDFSSQTPRNRSCYRVFWMYMTSLLHLLVKEKSCTSKIHDNSSGYGGLESEVDFSVRCGYIGVYCLGGIERRRRFFISCVFLFLVPSSLGLVLGEPSLVLWVHVLSYHVHCSIQFVVECC